MTRVCDVLDVPLGEGRAALLAGRRIAVFHTRRGWYALDQRCPHAGGPLADGMLADGCVTCPLHERRFDLESGRCLNDPRLQVGAYRVLIDGGGVFVAAVALAA